MQQRIERARRPAASGGRLRREAAVGRRPLGRAVAAKHGPRRGARGGVARVGGSGVGGVCAHGGQGPQEGGVRGRAAPASRSSRPTGGSRAAA